MQSGARSGPAKRGLPKTALGISLGLVAGLAVGYGLGRASLGTALNPLGSYEQGRADIQQPGEEGQLQVLSLTMTGTVKEVGDESLTFEESARGGDLAAGQPVGTTERVVRVTTDTEIVERVPKDPVAFRQEFEAFQADPANGALPPDPYTLRKIRLADLKVGATATVTIEGQVAQGETPVAVHIETIQGVAVSDDEAPPPLDLGPATPVR